MRDRTLEFLSLTGFDAMFKRQVDQVVGQFKSGFKDGFGEDVPTDAAEALRVVEAAYEKAKGSLANQIADVYEKHLDAGDIEALITFHRSPVGTKIAAIGPEVQVALGELTDRWDREVLKSVEPDLARLLGQQVAAPVQTPAAPSPAAALDSSF